MSHTNGSDPLSSQMRPSKPSKPDLSKPPKSTFVIGGEVVSLKRARKRTPFEVQTENSVLKPIEKEISKIPIPIKKESRVYEAVESTNPKHPVSKVSIPSVFSKPIQETETTVTIKINPPKTKQRIKSIDVHKSVNL